MPRVRKTYHSSRDVCEIILMPMILKRGYSLTLSDTFNENMSQKRKAPHGKSQQTGQEHLLVLRGRLRHSSPEFV